MNNYSRYIRQNNIIGNHGQEALANTKLLCIGCGGLGVLVSSYLVAAGVGLITLVDGDNIEESNLTRQITYKENDCNKNKAQTQAKFLQQLNSNCKVISYNNFLNKSNVYELIYAHDLILDCSDNFTTRYMISDNCTSLNKPLISASIEGFVGQVIVLLNNICYRCIFPNSYSNNSCHNGETIGSAIGITASIQANEALKFISNLNHKSYLIQIDSLINKVSQFNIKSDRKCINNHDDILLFYENKLKYLDFKELLDLSSEQIKIIDIRDKKLSINDELSFVSIKIEPNKISDIIKHIPKIQPLVVICNYGYKSKLAALKLISFGYELVYYSTINDKQTNNL